MPSRRLEDRIRDLCAKAIEADGEDFAPVLRQLQDALKEHSERLRKLAVQKLSPKNRE